MQVYHSALPFTPHGTLLYKTYAAEEIYSMHVIHGVPTQWPVADQLLTGELSNI